MHIAKRKSTILAIIVAITKIVLGKYIFVIKDELDIKEIQDELSEPAKRFHGSRATYRNIE